MTIKRLRKLPQGSVSMVILQWQIEAEEYEMLIRNEDTQLKREIAELSKRCCGKYNEALPVR